MDFVAIDFETATSNPGSICSMGICVVENNMVTETMEFLIKPQPFEFNEYNIRIHGITPEMVFCEPTFDKLWDKIRPYIENKLVIAHNAPFDVGALKASLAYFDIEYPCFEYLCTVQLSRKAYPDMPGHKLNQMADAFKISFSHHDSEEDAFACAMVMLHIINDYDIEKVSDFKERFGIEPSKVFPGCDKKKEESGKDAHNSVCRSKRNGKKLQSNNGRTAKRN